MNERHFITITLRCCCRRQRWLPGLSGEDVSLWEGAEKLHGTGTGSKRIRLQLQGFASVLWHLQKSGIRLTGSSALLRSVGKAKPPAASSSALIGLCWECSEPLCIPERVQGLVWIVGFFSFSCWDSHRSSTSSMQCFPRFPNRFQTKPFLQPPWWESALRLKGW